MPNRKLLLLAVLFVATAAFVPAGGMRIGWNPKYRPRLPLTHALQIAHEALNMEEGLPKDDETFYCINGGLAITCSRDGDWTFRFGSKENGERWVIVDLDGIVAVRKEPQLWY